ncbi:MAG: reverse transcriptase (RNA-dependent polymerase), partial [Gammaproteobacteria bacterium]|nr:reverse transcriptase (RNA-dependent polymerase) [Gammaproteobacteria bacterium]
ADEAVTLWNCSDRLILSLIQKIIKPTFAAILSPLCYHQHGISGVKLALNAVIKATASRRFRYSIRIDIKSYYASINHSILLEQLNNDFDDPRLRHYFNDIVTIPVDKDAVVSLPTQGIPSRSSLSPFFGALYLTPLDRAFEQRSCFYARYMDDVIILCETRNQFVSAKKRLKKILASLKLKLSSHKTKMGVFKTFHFLGVNFSSAQTELHKKPQKKAIIAIHPRSCRRSLDKATAMKEDAVPAATIQQYLMRWALWWKRAVTPATILQ